MAESSPDEALERVLRELETEPLMPIAQTAEEPLSEDEKIAVINGCLEHLTRVFPGVVIIAEDRRSEDRSDLRYGYRGGYFRMLGLVEHMLTRIGGGEADEDDEEEV